MCNNQNCKRMKTTLLVVGRTVEQHYITAINDYIQRTKHYITFDKIYFHITYYRIMGCVKSFV